MDAPETTNASDLEANKAIVLIMSLMLAVYMAIMWGYQYTETMRQEEIIWSYNSGIKPFWRNYR